VRWTGRTSSRAAVPASVLPPVFGPVADCQLKAVGDGWASAQQPHTSLGCSLDQPPPSMWMHLQRYVGRWALATGHSWVCRGHGQWARLSRTEAGAVQIGGSELRDWTGAVKQREFPRGSPLHRLLHDKECGRSVGFVGAGLPWLDQLAIEVGLQLGTVVAPRRRGHAGSSENSRPGGCPWHSSGGSRANIDRLRRSDHY